MAGKTLTAKEAAFVREFAKDFNGTQAVIRAKYKPDNARRIATSNLSKVHIQQALTRYLQKIIKRDEVAVDRVVSELATIAFANMADYATWSDKDGVSLTPSGDLTRQQTAAVQEIYEDSTTYTDKDGNPQVRRKVKFKLHDKVRALGSLEKYLELGQLGMLPWPQVLDAMAEMARIVELYVSDPDVLASIKEGWSRINIRPQTVVHKGAEADKV